MNKIQCDTCIKADVCKYKKEYNLYKAENARNVDGEGLFFTSIDCSKYSFVGSCGAPKANQM